MVDNRGVSDFISFKGDLLTYTKSQAIYLQPAFVGCVNVFIASFQLKLALFPLGLHLIHSVSHNENMCYGQGNNII